MPPNPERVNRPEDSNHVDSSTSATLAGLPVSTVYWKQGRTCATFVSGAEIEEVNMLKPRAPDPPNRRSERLDVIRTFLQAAQTVLLLLRIIGGC